MANLRDTYIEGSLQIRGDIMFPYGADTTYYVPGCIVGTEDIWTYRKWSNGIAECWGTYSATLDINTTHDNGIYIFGSGVSNKLVTRFPEGLFSDTPKCFAQYKGAVKNGIAYATFPYIGDDTLTSEVTNEIRVMRVGDAQNNLVCTVDFYAIGPCSTL